MEIFLQKISIAINENSKRQNAHMFSRSLLFNDVTELIYLKDYLYDSFDLFNLIFQLFYLFNLITI